MNHLNPQNVSISGDRRGSAAAAVSLIPMVTVNTASVAKSEKQEVPVPDEKLFSQAIAGDRGALGELIGRYEKVLFGLLMRMTGGDQHRSDDLFQETFLHAMRASKTFDRKMHFKPWITAIAVNLLRDDARKRKVRGEVGLVSGADSTTDRAAVPEPVAEQENPGQVAERRDEERKVQKALDELTELEREVVLLHFYQSMTLVETAKTLEVPLGTIKSRLHAALTRLSGILGSERKS